MTSRRIPVTAACLAVLAAGGLSACDHRDALTEPESDISFVRAREIARANAEEVRASLPKGTRIVPFDGDTHGSTGYCADRSDPPEGTPVNWQGDWEVTGVPLDPALIGSVSAALEDRGWRRAYGGKKGDDRVSYEDPRGFNMVFTVSDVRVSLTEGTPCVKAADPDNPLDTGGTG